MEAVRRAAGVEAAREAAVMKAGRAAKMVMEALRNARAADSAREVAAMEADRVAKMAVERGRVAGARAPQAAAPPAAADSTPHAAADAAPAVAVSMAANLAQRFPVALWEALGLRAHTVNVTQHTQDGIYPRSPPGGPGDLFYTFGSFLNTHLYRTISWHTFPPRMRSATCIECMAMGVASSLLQFRVCCLGLRNPWSAMQAPSRRGHVGTASSAGARALHADHATDATPSVSIIHGMHDNILPRRREWHCTCAG